jgi:hypothetical protein
MKTMKDRTGLRFGKLTVVSFSHKRNGKQYFWTCRCDCGREKVVNISALVQGDTASCGCFEQASRYGRRRKHGMYGTSEYIIWRGILARCLNVNDPAYHNYGGRGITVCKRWRSFANFLADMGKRPSRGHSIDRKNNNGNYSPRNCRWATRTEQARNSRRCRTVTHDGRTLSIAEWAELVGLHPATLLHRVNIGWPFHKALSHPLRYKRK